MGEIFNGPLGGCDWLVEERGGLSIPPTPFFCLLIHSPEFEAETIVRRELSFGT